MIASMFVVHSVQIPSSMISLHQPYSTPNCSNPLSFSTRHLIEMTSQGFDLLFIRCRLTLTLPFLTIHNQQMGVSLLNHFLHTMRRICLRLIQKLTQLFNRSILILNLLFKCLEFNRSDLTDFSPCFTLSNRLRKRYVRSLLPRIDSLTQENSSSETRSRVHSPSVEACVDLN